MFPSLFPFLFAINLFVWIICRLFELFTVVGWCILLLLLLLWLLLLLLLFWVEILYYLRFCTFTITLTMFLLPIFLLNVNGCCCWLRKWLVFGSMDTHVQFSRICHTTQNDCMEVSPSGCSLHISYTLLPFPNIIPFQLPPNQSAVLSKFWKVKRKLMILYKGRKRWV